MVFPQQVRATVKDITKPSVQCPARLALDTNALHLVFYGNLGALEAAAGWRSSPRTHQQAYSPWVNTALKAGQVKLFTSIFSILELMNTTEVAELQLRWFTDPQTQSLPWDEHRGKKVARKAFHTDLLTIRRAVDTLVSSTRRMVEAIPVQDLRQALLAATPVWAQCAADVGDVMLVQGGSRIGLPDILTDDADLATITGVTVYTANSELIRAAQAAGQACV